MADASHAIILAVSGKTRFTLLLIILLAFGLRVYQLDTQSIWYDEGVSIFLAQQSPAQAIAFSAATDHPPLHALLLGAWINLAGVSDFAVRFFSVFYGVLAAALIFALGRTIDQRVGLIAAFLTAISPIAVYYSQETRGYMLLTILILIATIAFAKLINGDQRRRIRIAYIAAMVAALYTHYFAAFAWAAINVAWVINLVRGYVTDRRRSLTPSQGVWSWVIAQLIILVCFLPWLPNAITQAGTNTTYFPGRVSWQTVVGDTWRAFAVGEWGDAAVIGWIWLILIALGLMAVFDGNASHEATEARSNTNIKTLRFCLPVSILLLSLVIIPLLLMSGLAWLKPKFAPRYLLPSLPAMLALASMGITRLIDGLRSRYCLIASIGLVISLALPLASAASLWRMYTDPSLARPDVRSVARYIEANADPSDAIVLIGGHQAPAFNHYYRSQADVIPMPPDLMAAAQSPLDAHAIAQLADIAAQHSRIWLVLWQNEISDPTNVILDALTTKAKRLTVGQNFHDMGVLLFDVRTAQFDLAPQHVVDYQFTDPLRLVGYNVDTTRTPVDTPVEFGLYLQADGSIGNNYTVFAHLVSPAGTLIAQADHIAGADSYPTSLWHPGSLILNRFKIDIPNGTLPGEYHITVGLYDSNDRLKLIDGRDQIDLFTIMITP